MSGFHALAAHPLARPQGERREPMIDMGIIARHANAQRAERERALAEYGTTKYRAHTKRRRGNKASAGRFNPRLGDVFGHGGYAIK